MNKTFPCPICGNNLKYTSYSGEFGTEEIYEDCHICGYYYQFIYGTNGEIVGNKWFMWDYTTKRDNPVFKRMRKAEFMAKRRWKKFRKGVTCKDCPF